MYVFKNICLSERFKCEMAICSVDLFVYLLSGGSDDSDRSDGKSKDGERFSVSQTLRDETSVYKREGTDCCAATKYRGLAH